MQVFDAGSTPGSKRHSSHTNSSSRKVGSLSKQAVKTGLRQKSDRLTINLAWWLLGSAIALVWQVEVLTLRSEEGYFSSNSLENIFF